MARRLGLAAAVLAALLLIAAAGLAAFASLPALEDQRRAAATALLERFIARPVTVAGPVTLRPGLLTEVTLADVRLGDAGPEAWRGTLAVAEARFAFATLPALLGNFTVDHFAGRGFSVELDGAAGAAGGPFRLSSVVRPIALFLGSPLTESLVLEDVRIERRAGPDGWSSTIVLDRATAATDAAGKRSIELDGTVNERPLALGAEIDPPTAVAALDRPVRPFRLEASLPGIEETLEGMLDVEGESLAADLDVTVPSIGDLLETLQLRRQLEGSGRLRLAVAGPVDALAGDGVRLEATLATGETVRLDGRIADLATLSGVALDLSADLRRRDGRGARPSDSFDVEVNGLSGRLAGSLAALTVRDLRIQTSLASADLVDIGPIGIDRVIRAADGRLALRGLTIRSGDPAALSLDLRGSVEDLLGFTGIALEGRFALDVLELAGGPPSPAALGRLTGSAALADAGGRLALQRLDARLAGDGPLALTLTKPATRGDASPGAIAVEIAAPDLDALATALGAAPIGGGAMTFGGSLDVVDALRVIGRGELGRSAFWLDLRQDVVDGRVTLDGAVKSPRLRLADLPRLAGLAGLLGQGGGEGERAAPGGLAVAVALDAEARIVDGQGAEQGAFAATLAISDGAAVLAPVRLDYLGGTATASLRLGLDQEPPPARLEAEIRALNTAALLAELGVQPLLEGELDADLALTARGTDRAALLRSLGGEATLAMGEGRIGTRLLDLTAQNVVSWLFSAGRDTRLVCAAARLRLTRGIANLEGLVLRTENVQLLGGGSVNLGHQTLDLAFDPRPARGGLLQAATPFRVQGPIAAPVVELRSPAGVAGRAVVETVTLPLNLIGSLFGGGRRTDADCSLEP